MNRLSPFGLEAWLESTRLLLPLRGMAIRAELLGGFATVEIDQIFIQSNEQPLNCRYVFPLPSDAAVHRCEMHVNGRVVLARVEERSIAEALYKKAREAGHRAALASGERDNLFTLELGNLQPGDVILMRFAYIQPLQRLQDHRSFRVPTNVGVRFIPGKPLLRPNSGQGSMDDTDEVPDASRISPPRIDRDHPDAATLHVSVRLLGGVQTIQSLSSPSHLLAVRQKGNDFHASLAADTGFPDQDFVMTWLEPAPDTVVARSWLDDKRRGILELRLPQQEETASVGCDVYFLLDRSGSMAGENWSGACRALAGLKSHLHPETLVWLTIFESDHRDWAEKPLAAKNIDYGPDGSEIEKIGVSGGTYLLPALTHVVGKVQTHSRGRNAAILILTDGAIGNEEAVVLLGRQAGCPVHVVGIALSPNDALRAVAEATGGRAVFLTPGGDIPAATERFAPLLCSPVVRQLALPPGWETADGQPLRDITAGDDLIIPISASAEAPGLSLKGTSMDGTPWTAHPAPEVYQPAGLIWARTRIRHLERCDDASALILAKKFNLLCKTAAFIAWDEAEQVVIARRGITQPTMNALRRQASCEMSVEYSCESYALADSTGPMSMRELTARMRQTTESIAFYNLPPRGQVDRLIKSTEQLLRQFLPLKKSLAESFSKVLNEMVDLSLVSEPEFSASARNLLADLISALRKLAKECPRAETETKRLIQLAGQCRARVHRESAVPP